ncbi:2-keto-3-deoxygluconate oxidoreductase [Salmonella enterica subsp. enterica]|uniref:2-keto-3-deoxygluconate oxidoreductase n=1 Tax=Salmonella enterica I TaxID=59201 RepID=A0A447TW16_SALET|nr:2-keto-3-deoxygluconate oxidoreductase [Salmonella enterica subsp. enterica]
MVFRRYWKRAVAEYGHIDILVNNAGLIRREDAIDFTEKRLGMTS